MTTLEDYQNVHGQKIGVRYYANKSLKPRSFLWNGERRIGYPLYIQVTAQNQTARLKSVIDIAVDADKVDQYLESDLMKLLIQDETEEVLRRVLAARPESKSKFNLTNALRNYSYETVDLSYVIGDSLMGEYVRARSKDLIRYFREEYEQHPSYAWIAANREEHPGNEVKPSEAFLENAAQAVLWGDKHSISPMAVYKRVRAESTQPDSCVRELIQTYGIAFFRLGEFSEAIRNQSNRLLTVSFFTGPEFEQVFTKCCDNSENLQLLRDGFTRFCLNHDDFTMKYLSKMTSDFSQFPLL